MRRTIPPILVAGLAYGCPGPGVPAAPASSPSPLPGPVQASAVATATPLVGPSPQADEAQFSFVAHVSPQVPCPGQEVVITGERFTGVHHVAAWLSAPDATLHDPTPAATPAAPANGVQLGEADVDAAGGFRIAFTLPARLGPTAAGTEIVLEPGGDYAITFVEDGHVGPPGIGFQLGTLTCPGYSPPPPLEAHLEPGSPCAGTTAHLRGSHFKGPVAKLQFARYDTRFLDGPRIDVEAPVTADGRFDYAFEPAQLKAPGVASFFEVGNIYGVAVSDPGTSRSLRLPLPYCNPGLVEALAAPGLPLVAGKMGAFGSPPAGPEALALRSQAELDAWTARHQLRPAPSADLPAVDFTLNEALVVSEATSRPLPFQLEIVAVEAVGGGYRVHAVRWFHWFSTEAGSLYDFVVVPRTDGPVTFAPVVEGFYTDRPEGRSRR